MIDAMPLIKCPDCSTQVSDQAQSCPSCGYPIAKREPDYVARAREAGVFCGSRPSSGPPSVSVVKSAKSRGVYIILGLFLGCLGIHNFYAGYHGRGAAQLIITLLLGWVIIGLVITALWALIEICTITCDAAGDPLM
jgi:TM2 domain-containing membrane protein YozV